LLVFQKVVRGEFDSRIVDLAEEREQKDELGFEDRVAFEFADPVAVGLLASEQAGAPAFDDGSQFLEPGRVALGKETGSAAVRESV
jgi:hypothetical protein